MSNTVAQCPHCKRTVHACALPRHALTCPASPAIVSRLRAELDDGTGCIVPVATYTETAHPGLPSARALFAHYATWRNVAAACGLQVRSSAQVRSASDAAHALYASLGLYESGTALVDTTGCKRREGDYTFDGLPVLTDAHGAAIVRPAHGGGVAYMVR